jgi:allantoin racemase
VAFTSGWTTDLEMVVADVRKAAEAMVEDGAEAIVIGSAGLSVMSTWAGLSSVGGDLRVPVFDCLTVGLKTAELRADLGRKLNMPSVSGGGWYAPFPEAERSRVDRLFGVGNTSILEATK